MKFDKKHKTIIKTLEPFEAEEYLDFLGQERIRHQEARDRIATRIYLWNSEYQRQIEEIKKIDERIHKVIKKFKPEVAKRFKL